MSQPGCPPRARRRTAIALACMVFASSGAAAAPPDAGDQPPAMLVARLDTIWMSPLTYGAERVAALLKGFVPTGWGEAPDGALMMAGVVDGNDVLLLRNAERFGPDSGRGDPIVFPDIAYPPGVPPPANPADPSRPPQPVPVLLGLTTGGDGAIWLGGRIRYMVDGRELGRSDALLAKLDAAGQALWVWAYANGRRLSVSGMAPAVADGVVIAGGGSVVEGSWLASKGADGTGSAEWHLGNGKGLQVAALPDGRTLVVGFADGGVAPGARRGQEAVDAALSAMKAGTYRDDVVAWTLGKDGHLVGPTPIREGVSERDPQRGLGFGGGSIALAPSGNAAYVVFNWFTGTRLGEVEVARIGLDGTVAWRRTLPETAAVLDKADPSACRPSAAALPNGDALVACALDGQVQLHRLNGSTGARRLATLAPPSCFHTSLGAKVALIVRRNGSVFVLGTEGLNEGCTWVAQATIADD